MDILIAEDDRVSALILQRALEKMGYSVIVARDGGEAWRLVNGGGIGLVVSDWMMPELDGLELCRRIRGRIDTAYTYVILLTSRDSRNDRLEGLEAGADDFLSKPLDTGELVARLNVAKRILGMQDQLRAHATQLAELHVALERQNALLAERASTDGLTGLSNRRHFDETLASAFSFAVRHDQPLSLVLLDVDHFKLFNDTFGHQSGDDVLRALADTLRSGTRRHDVVARYGGEEFVLILPGTGSSQALSFCERLRSSIEGRRWTHRSVTASFGVTTTTRPAQIMEDLLREADKALYKSKAEGRNRVTHFDEFLTDSVKERAETSQSTMQSGYHLGFLDRLSEA